MVGERGLTEILEKTISPDLSPVTQNLSGVSVAAASSVSTDLTLGENYGYVIATIKATYDATATAGVRVIWLYSPDGVNFDSEDDAIAEGNYVDLSFTAGGTAQRTIVIPAFSDSIRIVIENLDAAVAVIVDLWTRFGR